MSSPTIGADSRARARPLSPGVARQLALAASLACGLPMGACNKTQPKPQPMKPPAAAALPADPPVGGVVRYRFSAPASTITFAGQRRMNEKHKGSFGKFEGNILVADGSPEQSSVNVDIDMASLQADDPKLTEALKSPAFLDVAKYPTARFVSTGAHRGGELGATDTISGNFELRGITRPLDIPGTIHVRPDGVDVDAEVVLHRKDFGVAYPAIPTSVIGDEIVIELALYANRV
jgi:polyisoprenoid-binding protein YceI